MTKRCLLALGALAVACNRPAPPDGHGEPVGSAPAPSSHEEPHAEVPTRVALSTEVMEAAGIKTLRIRRSRLDAGLSLPGEIVADPDRSARIASPVAGRIERVEFREGDSVKKGQLLAVLRVPEVGRLRASQTIAMTKSKTARANAQRLRALVGKGLAAEQQALDAETEADSLDAEATGLRSQLAALGSGGAASVTLRAPVSGTVLSRDAIVGQPVGTEHTLGSIADLSEVWFVGRVFEKDLGRLRVGASADVDLNAYAKRSFSGSLEYIGQQVDPVARTLTARVRLKNPEAVLRIGLFGAARVAADGNEAGAEVLAVPHAALTEIAGKTAVFVRHGEFEFERHDVTVGRSGVGSTEIVAGLSDGEVIVVEGVFAVKSALLRSTLLEEEH
ncbi:MAG: efflux RND transporter periplasmic adaptor subunit [Myxococcales bacterium]|nr:efflux RND transporter periplasmic adaptor subunit [Myxococcales bacterium]